MKKFITFFVLLFTAFNMLAANITLYFVDESGWGNIHAYAWKNSTQANLAVWPGTKATLESKTMGGKDVYSYTFENTAADRIIFNNGGYGEQTADLIVNTSKPYYYNETWNTSITYDATATTYCMAGTASVSGTTWCCGQTWTPSGCELADGSISFSALPTGEYKFKITNGTWNSSWGYSNLTSTSGLTKDTDGNVVITLTKTSDIKIDFNSSTKKITVTITEVGTPVDPDDPQPTGEVTIAAIRNRLSINTNDFTDFAGLYVSELPEAGDATVSYEWQYSTDNATWAKYSAGDGATWDNIRPNTAGYYRCVLSYDLAGAVTTYTSNTLQITNKGGNSVSFSSKLPVFLVRTTKDFPTAGFLDNDGVAALKAKRSVDVKILWNEEGGNVTNSDINNADMLHYDRKARMNYRGSSSLRNPKKSYAFVTGDKNCDSKKLGEVKTKKFGMFGAEAQKDWVLYASYPDATYMRNILTFHQYAQMTGLWGVKCRYVELYVDGSYQGIYVFMDKITQDENRVNVNEDTGYIVKFDKTDEVDSYDGTRGYNEDYKRNTFVTSNTGRRHISTYDQYVDQAFEIEYPEREDLAEFDDDGNLVDDSAWDAKVAEIKGLFTKMENAILANDYAKLATIIDYDSWADYFIMNEFSRNADAYRISCVFTVNSASDKIVANPMWDYELGWGNQDNQTNGLMVEDVKYYSDDFPTPFWWTGKGKSGCNGILGDCKFRAKVLERWEKHIGTNGALNSTVLNAKIDSLKTVLSGGSEKLSVSTNSLKSWVTNRTSGLNTEFNTWDACPDLKFALVGTINGNTITSYANGVPFTMQDDGSYTAVFTASETTHNLQIITSTGEIWARDNSKNIVSTDENASSYATMTSGQTTGYANITTVANTEYTFTFKLNADGISGKLTYLKGESVIPDEPEADFAISAIRNRLSINTNDFTDFAGLYVSELPKVEGGELASYKWQYSTDNSNWTEYSAGQGASWDNIRPNKAGYYRCVITYNVGGETVEQLSNVLQITSNSGSTVTFSSKLPVFLVRTSIDFPVHTGSGYPDNDGVAALKAKRSVDVKVLWNQDGGSVTNADVNNSSILYYDRKARMNYRGSSSLYNDKKSYAFVTGDKNCDSKKPGEVKTKKLAMFGDDAHKDWVLYASAPDATYMRNVLSYHQYAKMTGLWGVRCRHVELYVDGEYKGIYVFMDKMTADENRINIGEEGYIVRFDKTDIVDRYEGYAGKNADYKRCTFTTSYTGKTNISTYNQVVDQAFEIEYPEREDISSFDDDDNVTDDSAWEAKVSAVKAKFTEMEKAILANDYDKLATIIDYDTWAEWFIINEFTKNADAYRISCVFTLNSIDDKIVANPIWDYELGLGNQNTNTSGLMVEENQYYSDAFPTPFWWTGKGKSGCNGILGDCKFRAIVKERWAKHIAADGALNSTVLSNKMDSIKSVLATSSKATSVSTSSLKSWVTNRTSGLNSVISAWETCPVPEISDLVAPVFTQVYVGETANGTATYSVTNATNVEVVLSGDDAFSVVSEADGAVEIKFAPSAAGTFNGVLTITADGVVTETINFSASAILKPEITDLVAPVFTQIYVGETANGTATFSVANASEVEVVLSGDDAFGIVSEVDGVVEVEFAPSTAGTFTGVLTITADGVVTETINFSASAILKPEITDLVAPVFAQIYVGETANGTATFSVANASSVEVVLSGDDAFSIVSEVDGMVEVEFASSAAGTFTGVLTITADGVVTETINFSASAILKPVISDLVAPVFGEIYVGENATSVATFSVQNASDVEVELAGEGFSIVSEADGYVEILFAPTAAGTLNGALTITADGVVTETINFSASAILKPEISDLVAPVFGEIYVGENATSVATFSVLNASNVEVELSGEAFSILSDSDSSVEIVFTPTTAGTFSGTLTITADGVVTETINFSASAILKPEISDLVAPVFTEIYVGETANGTATFTVANASAVEVVLSGDAAFSIVSEVDGVVEVEFAPSAAGTFNGVLTITADGVVTETINFSASAILKPEITDLVAPVFEQIYVGDTAKGTATFSVANASAVEVVLSGDNAFSIVSETEGAVEIEFAPSSAGTFNGVLTITADGVVTETINFFASAILKPEITNLVAPVFTEIYVGETANGTATFSVANASEVEVVLSGDDAFSIVSETEGAVEVEFAPSVAGTFNGVLTITADGVVTETIEFSAIATESISTDIEENEALNIYANEGTIYCDEEFTIYNLAGLDVTSLNGSLQGVYLVVTAKGNKQVSVW